MRKATGMEVGGEEGVEAECAVFDGGGYAE